MFDIPHDVEHCKNQIGAGTESEIDQMNLFESVNKETYQRNVPVHVQRRSQVSLAPGGGGGG